MSTLKPNFTAYSHPVLAVVCEQCHAVTGSMCKRPSGHAAADFHKSRKLLADAIFIDLHGEAASIEKNGDGWIIDPNGYRPESKQLNLI